MAFFRDLHMAAQDLRQNGLNLDSLREEIGNEKREPLPLAPPLKGQTTPQKVPGGPRAQGSAESETEEIAVIPAADEGEQQPPQDVLTNPAKRQTERFLGAAGDFLQTAKVSLPSVPSLVPPTATMNGAPKETTDASAWMRRAERAKKTAEKWEREAAAQAAACAVLDGRLTMAARQKGAEREELTRLREAARRREEVAFQTQRERDLCAAELEDVALRRVDALQAEVASLRREKRRADQLEKDLASLKAEKEASESQKSVALASASEVRGLHVQLAAARSAAAAAARAARAQVDLKTRKADEWEAEASRLRVELRETRAVTGRVEAERDALKRERDRVTDVSKRRAKREEQVDGLRDMLKEALQKQTDAEVALASEKARREDAERCAADVNAKAQTDARAWAGELAAARQAARDARTALVDRAAIGATTVVSENGSLPAAHARTSSDDAVDDEEPCVVPGDSASNLHHESASDVSEAASMAGSGAAEYLKSVVLAALPNSSASSSHGNDHSSNASHFLRLAATPTTRPDAATRTRLVPVLRSLLALPHETVAASLDALAKTQAGGDFALALVVAASAASDKAKRIVCRADAAEMREDRVKRLDLERELVDAKDNAQKLARSLDDKDAALRAAALDFERRSTAQDEAKRRTLAEYEAQTREALDLARAVDARCAELAVEADEAKRNALQASQHQQAFQAKVETLLQERKLGLDESQLDYLRATLASVLKGFANDKLRAQLLPVLVNILKLDPDDPRAHELIHLA